MPPGPRVRVRERGGWLPALRRHDRPAVRLALGLDAVLAVAVLANGALALAGLTWRTRSEGLVHVGWAAAWRYVGELALSAAVLGVGVTAVVVALRLHGPLLSLLRGGFTLCEDGIRGAYGRPLRPLLWSEVERLRWEDRSRTWYGFGDVPGGGVDGAFQPVTLVAVLRGGGLLRVGARHLDGPGRLLVEERLRAAAALGCCPVSLDGGPGDGGGHVRVL